MAEQITVTPALKWIDGSPQVTLVAKNDGDELADVFVVDLYLPPLRGGSNPKGIGELDYPGHRQVLVNNNEQITLRGYRYFWNDHRHPLFRTVEGLINERPLSLPQLTTNFFVIEVTSPSAGPDFNAYSLAQTGVVKMTLGQIKPIDGSYVPFRE